MTTTPPSDRKILPRPEAEAGVSKRVMETSERIRREIGDDLICLLTFDRPDSAANVFDHATMAELEQHLNFIANNPHLKGLIITSAKKSIFVAGADLTELGKAKSAEDLRGMIEQGQNVFGRLAALRIPTVAAIHGACLGGGYEMALACDYRIASGDKATKIGLPETMLGILPAWGGSTRLPRLLGLPRALEVILAGKTLAAQAARKRGMIDDIAPRERLVERARALIQRHGTNLGPRSAGPMRWLLNSSPAASLIRKRTEKQILQRTRGHYPAILRALEVVTRGVTGSIDASLALERDAVLELGNTETCRNLIRIFFLQERAKKLTGTPGDSKPAEPIKPVERMAVIGAGVMGAGIAQWASAREIAVVLRDVNHEAVAKGLVAIDKLYQEGVKRHAFTKLEARAGMDRIAPAAVEVPLRAVDLVVEAAVERMDLKKQLFTRLGELAGPGVILASNTSALSISEIAGATRHPERVIGIHFFNPVHRMQLVEVVVGRQTDAQVVRRAVRFVQQIGKLPVVVKDSPGFLVNRILMPYLLEAGYLFSTGARVEDIDESMLEFGMPMGPLRLIDEVGLDVCHHVAADLANHFSDRLQSPEVLSNMLKDGLLGKKSGAGFYEHAKGVAEATVNPAIDRYHGGISSANLVREQLRDRMVLLMINEAARCLEEGIVAEAADVDFGMIMGTGFAPFLGGPLRFADYLGAARVVEEMKRLAGGGELRFTPCSLLQTQAANGSRFYET